MGKAIRSDSRHARALATSFTKIAAAIAQNHGVRVVPSSKACCTDGKVIYVPFAAEIAQGATAQTLNAMLDHELGHVRVEEECRRAGIPGFVERLRLASSRGDREMSVLMNVVEDIRIEHDLGLEYPGMKDNLSRLNERMMGIRRDDAAKGKHENLWREITCGFVARARGFDDQWMTPKASDYLNRCDDLVKRASKLAGGAKGMLEGIALASELKDRLREIADARREEKKASRKEEREREDGGDDPSRVDHVGELGDEPEESEDHEGSKGGKGGDDEDEPSTADDLDAPGGSCDGEDGEDDNEDGEGGDDDEGDEDATPGELDGGPDFDDVRDELRDALDCDLIKDARDRGIKLPHPLVVEMDKWRVGAQGDNLRDPYGHVRAEVRGQISALRQRQIARIQTRARARLHVGLDDGDLDQSRLHEVAVGARDVYSEIRPGRHVNVAIQVLLDLSASTTGNCERFMRRTLVALAESWEPIRGMAYDILGFSNLFPRWGGGMHRDFRGLRLGLQDDGVHYVRMPFEMIHFKQYHEGISAFRSRFAEVGPHEDNCDHEAVWMAAKRLAPRPEERKILCVINDGAPESHGVPYHIAEQGLRENIRAITSAGIEVWGIGAGTDAPARYYNESTGARNVVIDDLSTMAPTLLQLFSKRIEDAS